MSNQKNFSSETALEIDKEVRRIIDNAHEIAREVILKNKDDLELIAKTLLEHEQITAEEIDYLLENRHLKRDEKPVEKAPAEEPLIEEPKEDVLQQEEEKGE